VMAPIGVRTLLRHRAIATVAMVLVLLTNIFVVGQIAPSQDFDGGLPSAAHCQGGGPGCAEQPLIPPPVGGLPHFEMPAPAAFGALVAIEPAAPDALPDAPPSFIEHPPSLTTDA
jgi:hypothetical protein